MSDESRDTKHNSVSMATRVQDAADLFSQTGFASAFAAFLRHNRDWRRRRIDRLMPIDRDLASRSIALQGVIEADLLKSFLAGPGRDLGLERVSVRDGDQLTAVIPAISQGKRLLLDYSIRDSGGRSIPMLSRMEAAQNMGQDLLGTLVGGIDRREAPKLEEVFAGLAGGTDPRGGVTRVEAGRAAFRSIYVLLVTLAFHYPFALRQRLDEWTRGAGSVGTASPLSGAVLEKWISVDADIYRAGVGELITQKMKPLFEVERPLEIPPRFGIESGKHFSSIEQLVLHAVRDLLEVVASLSQTAPHALRGDIAHPEVLASEAGQHAVDGVRLLETMLDLQKDKDEHGASLARQAVMNALERWTAYLAMDIRLGVPFQVKISETLLLDPPQPLRSRLRLGGLHATARDLRQTAKTTSLHSLMRPGTLKAVALEARRRIHLPAAIQRYPLAMGDADIYHVEVTTEDPEFGLAEPRICEGPGYQGEPRTLAHFFPTRQAASDRLIHLYATRPRELSEGRILEESPPLLEVRFPITLSVVVGYAAAALALLVAGGYVLEIWVEAIASGDPPTDFRSIAAVGALAVTLSLWLTRIQQPRPIVHRKLWWAHWIFYGALLLIIVPAGVYGVRWLIADIFS